ncbi:hypothetical protein FLAG1_11146 [Fusarium langsethiae]|uniref:Uncharacterized protein n=1 Tax=Fusarium langsethiae TaxID=179993 RepID=A0A0N0DB09_FUSLA|nr:hypothetical protein FLAG1_11146 [Fusarium langsethiae]GKU06892.1 unnamed protein product [Fusarium langsethiae]GKU15788.1 unnamed protein product [Fusarium langsethiae]
MTSSNSSYSQLAKHNLALCLLGLDQMQRSYISADAAYKLFDRGRIMVKKTLREPELAVRDLTLSRERQGIETAQWLDDSESHDLASMGMLSAFWTPFADATPDDSFGNSFYTQVMVLVMML